MSGQFNVFVELADAWDVQAQDAKPAERGEQLRECADALRAIVDYKRKPVDCPHAQGPFRYCFECPVSPCPVGIGKPKP